MPGQILQHSFCCPACELGSQGFLKVWERERSPCGMSSPAEGHSHGLRPPIPHYMTLENPKQLNLDGNMPAAGGNECLRQNLGHTMSFLTWSNNKLHDFRLILKRYNTKSQLQEYNNLALRPSVINVNIKFFLLPFIPLTSTEGIKDIPIRSFCYKFPALFWHVQR